MSQGCFSFILLNQGSLTCWLLVALAFLKTSRQSVKPVLFQGSPLLMSVSVIPQVDAWNNCSTFQLHLRFHLLWPSAAHEVGKPYLGTSFHFCRARPCSFRVCDVFFSTSLAGSCAEFTVCVTSTWLHLVWHYFTKIVSLQLMLWALQWVQDILTRLLKVAHEDSLGLGNRMATPNTSDLKS